jgi:hypothetical protein
MFAGSNLNFENGCSSDYTIYPVNKEICEDSAGCLGARMKSDASFCILLRMGRQPGSSNEEERRVSFILDI